MTEPDIEPISPAWEEVAAELREVGVNCAEQACLGARSRGALPHEARQVIRHWQAHEGAWTPGLLYAIVKGLREGAKVSWPEPCADYLARQADQQRRDKEERLLRERRERDHNKTRVHKERSEQPLNMLAELKRLESGRATDCEGP